MTMPNLLWLRLLVSIRGRSSRRTLSMYPLFSVMASSMVWFRALGHPPRTTRFTASSIERLIALDGAIVPLKRESNVTAPVESPDSNSDMGRMRSRPMRPVPLCSTPLYWGVDDPVSRNLPERSVSSTAKRTASQILGISCHSSMRRGSAPSSMYPGEASASLRLLKSLAGSETKNRAFYADGTERSEHEVDAGIHGSPHVPLGCQCPVHECILGYLNL